MRGFLVLILSFFVACNNVSYQEFSDRAKATNLIIKGLKEGRWVENLDSANLPTTDENAPYYKLTIYKGGKPFGLVKTFYKNSKLRHTVTYKNGYKNGISTTYYLNGSTQQEQNYENDTLIEEEKDYYEDGKLHWTITYSKGWKGSDIHWTGSKCSIEEDYKNGKIKQETYFNSGDTVRTVYYDTNGFMTCFKRYNTEIYTYYKNGNLKSRLEIYNGDKKLEDQYDTNGKLKCTLHYIIY